MTSTLAQPQLDTAPVLGDVPHPIVVLAPPRSFTSVVGAMLGQHPQLYGLPEIAVWRAETVAEWWQVCAAESWPMQEGLLRAVAEIVFGEQTDRTVMLAGAWLRRRNFAGVGLLVEELARQVAPRTLVDKTPGTVYKASWMQRIESLFPETRFLHLTRHPYGHGRSVVRYIGEMRHRNLPVPAWLTALASFAPGSDDVPPAPSGLDPQHAWLRLNQNIVDFLQAVPAERQLRVRGEDVLRDPDGALAAVARWLRIDDSSTAIDAMKHPETSPYSRVGPIGARYGNDPYFLNAPALRPARAELHSLDAPLPWRGDDLGFTTEVRDLAASLGYT